MAINEAIHPRWLIRFSDTKFYFPCKEHSSTGGNFFCIDCMIEPFCGKCKQTTHDSHQVLQVLRTSYSTTVRVGNIKHLVDVSGVKIYRVNDNDVYFIESKSLGGQRSGCNNVKETRKCETCGYNVSKDGYNYNFCSIACKIKARQNEDRHLNDEDAAAVPSSCRPSPKASYAPSHKASRSLKKRRRKGKPFRSPLY